MQPRWKIMRAAEPGTGKEKHEYAFFKENRDRARLLTIRPPSLPVNRKITPTRRSPRKDENGQERGQTVCPALPAQLQLGGKLSHLYFHLRRIVAAGRSSGLFPHFSRTFAALLLHRYRTDSVAFSGFHPVPVETASVPGPRWLRGRGPSRIMLFIPKSVLAAGGFKFSRGAK